MPYDYEALQALFDGGVNSPEKEQFETFVAGLSVNLYEDNPTLQELAQVCEHLQKNIAAIRKNLRELQVAKTEIPHIESYQDQYQQALKDIETAEKEVREAESAREELEKRGNDLKKEEKELYDKLSEIEKNMPARSLLAFDDEWQPTNPQALEIQKRLKDIDNERMEDLPLLKEKADEEIRKKKEALSNAQSKVYSPNDAMHRSKQTFDDMIKFDLVEAGLSINDYVGRLEHSDTILTTNLLMTKDSVGPTLSRLLTVLAKMPHTDSDYARVSGAVGYLFAVATALNGVLVHNEKQTASRQIIKGLKEFRQFQNRNAANVNNDADPQDENVPPMEDFTSPRTKAKVKEILDYQVRQEDAAAEYQKLDEEEARLRESIKNNSKLLGKYPILRKGSVEEISELLHTPSIERGTAFETEEETRRRYIEERSETAAATITEGITTPGYKQFIQDMIKLDLEQPGKGQAEFFLQYQQKGFSVLHKTVDGVDQEIQLNPQEVVRAIQSHEPKKADLDEDVQSSVKHNEEDQKFFDDHKADIEKYLNLKTVQLKKASLVQKYPDTVIQPIFQKATKRQYDESFQYRIDNLLRRMNQKETRSTFWDTTDYKNFRDALTAVAQGTGDLTNLKNMAEAYINAKSANPRSAYGKARLTYAKFVKKLIEGEAPIRKAAEDASNKAEQELDQLGKMSVDQFLAVHQAQEEMDLLVNASSDVPLSPRQKEKAQENMLLLLGTKAAQKFPNDAPTPDQLKRSFFPSGTEITTDLLKQMMQQTPEQIKESTKGTVRSDRSLEYVENLAWIRLNNPQSTPEIVRESISQLISVHLHRESNASDVTSARILADGKSALESDTFKEFIEQKGLDNLRQTLIQNATPRMATAMLAHDYFHEGERDLQAEAAQATVPLEKNKQPLDTKVITQQNAQKAKIIREEIERGKIQKVKENNAVSARNEDKSVDTVGFFDRDNQYHLKSQLSANRLDGAQYEGYIAIGDPQIDARNTVGELATPKTIARFIKNIPGQSEEWYQKTIDNLLDLFYKNMTGNGTLDRVALYSDIRDTYLVHPDGRPGIWTEETGKIGSAQLTIIGDLVRRVEKYGNQVESTCKLLGREAPKNRGELEDLQKELIIRKMLYLKQDKTLRPEYYQEIRNMLDDPECTLEQRNFLITVDTPTLKELSQQSPTVEKFVDGLYTAQDQHYATMEATMLQEFEQINAYEAPQSKASANAPVHQINLRSSIMPGRGSSLRPSIRSGRESIRESRAANEDPRDRRSGMAVIPEDEPQAEERKSDASQFVR